jgi:tryptophanyl-tRNA synthetase
MVKFLAPIRTRTNNILANRTYLQDAMKQGLEKARASAAETIALVRKAVGVNY